MTDLYSTFTSILLLLGNAAFMIVVAFISINLLPRSLAARKGLMAKLVLGIVLGVLAIYGTLMGTKLLDGTIVNVRELAAMIAGVTGGPVAGTLAGVIGGIHRYTVGGATFFLAQSQPYSSA